MLTRIDKEVQATPQDAEAQRKEVIRLFSAPSPRMQTRCPRLHAGIVGEGALMKRRRRTARKRNRQRLAAHSRDG